MVPPHVGVLGLGHGHGHGDRGTGEQSRHVRQFDPTGRPNVEPQALGVGHYERQQRILVHVSA
jgi:hypothetical protein